MKCLLDHQVGDATGALAEVFSVYELALVLSLLEGVGALEVGLVFGEGARLLLEQEHLIIITMKQTSRVI